MGKPISPNEKEPTTMIGKELRRARLSKQNLSQKDAATKVQVSRWTWNQWEMGSVSPSGKSLALIKYHFNLDLEPLLYFNQPPTPPKFKVDLPKEKKAMELPVGNQSFPMKGEK